MARDPLQYLYLATVNTKLGRMEEAEWAAREGIARAPQRAEYPYTLGVVLERRGKLEEAAQAYRAALQIDSSHERARSRLAALPNASGSHP
jgi:Flp pilus assembly protein TadD